MRSKTCRRKAPHSFLDVSSLTAVSYASTNVKLRSISEVLLPASSGLGGRDGRGS